jgi:hypothetical protein
VFTEELAAAMPSATAYLDAPYSVFRSKSLVTLVQADGNAKGQKQIINSSENHRKILIFTICSRILAACVMGLTHTSPFFVVLQRPRSQKMTNSPEVSKGAVEFPQETM